MSASTIAAASKSKINKVLTHPSKIAHALDWNKASGSHVLNLNIRRDRIDLAVASHPERNGPIFSLPSIPLYQQHQVSKKAGPSAGAAGRSLSSETVRELATVARDWQVCGLVVGWPVQSDTGWCGAQCGRVLHTLDQLVELDGAKDNGGSNGSDSVLTNRRPLCLWNPQQEQQQHQQDEQERDEWGRDASYSRISHKNVHVASIEQYQDDPNTDVADIWNDFCQKHWPELYEQNRQQASCAGADIDEPISSSPAPTNTPTHRRRLSFQEQEWLENNFGENCTDAYARVAL